MDGLNGIIHYVMGKEENRKTAEASNITVGLPRAMTYYEHGKLWQNFFTLLGCTVRVSPETNRRILDKGVSLCSNETCLPVKVMAGHVAELSDKCDTVFIPRYLSTAPHEMCCPKLCGLPDMIRMNLRGKADIMEVTVDVDKGFDRTDKTIDGIAERINVSKSKAHNAFERAVKNKLNADAKARLSEDMEIGTLDAEKTVVVLGHPYMLYDRFLSMNLIGKLKAAHLNVITPDMIKHDERIINSYPFYGKRNFYGIGSDNLGCAYICENRHNAAGLIYLTPFACGVDSLTTEFISRKLDNKLPLMVLTVDEHTGEAGFDTRIEAFLDMIS
ncbi:MAG TPA: acyl-CoA dehydratase activase-related protein [Ruminiclostridium sp.]|nr:acyl-CoA dehydratase activase-related protein [Ruminiclostridium sp.]